MWRTVVTPDEVAHRLSGMQLPDVTPDGLRVALAQAVDTAMYWQEPDGVDVLNATEPVRRELRRVGEHIARSLHSQWWTTPPALTDQWSVWTWGDDCPDLPVPTAADRLHLWGERTLVNEERAARDPSTSFFGWWSTPPTRSSTRRLADGTPAGLWFVEDSMGWERAVTRCLTISAGAEVYEIDGRKAWAELCRRFPLEVTAQIGEDWRRTTGRSGRWVVPGWTLVASEYEGVHLTVAGYLAAAGTAIDVDADTASVIAGWGPDETYWLTDALVGGDFQTWRCDTAGRHPRWAEEPR
ncbi:hypothetical protein G419_23019 [Rhodococcus triatomae BKS 15-14]|nr:hypothetical protein G419_23019 [Rhodococcus triatomae BKS 15-14]